MLSVLDPKNYSTYFVKIDNVKFKKKVIPGDTLVFKLKSISAAFAAIIANGKTTRSDRHNTVRPRLILKPGSTLGVLSNNMVGRKGKRRCCHFNGVV